MNTNKNVVSHTELVKVYLHNRVLRQQSQQNCLKYMQTLERALPCSPAMLTRDMLVDWRTAELGRGLAVVSWNTTVRHLKPILQYGIEKELLPYHKNPFDKLTLRPPRKPKKTLNNHKIAQIRDYLQQLQRVENKCWQDTGRLHPVWFWRTVFETLLETGIRRNQLLHLQCSDINLKQMVIHIRVEGSKTHREYDVPVSESLLPWLARLLREAQKKKFRHDAQLFNVTRFSSRSFGKEHMDGDHVSAVFTDLSKRLGFKASPHRLRHTLATELMRCPEANMHMVKEMLGHTNLATTLEYVQPDMDAMRRMLNSRQQFHSQTGA